MVNIAAKNTLAKLLAKEGITVQHGNYETAYFDVENRVLGLPVWKDMDNLYDLLVGHEVGHALFTPPEGWHSATQEIPGCPRQFVNIIEDIRIEKLVQRSYPGLVLSFKKGYTNLHDRDFFKIGGIVDILFSQFKLIDRINIKAKLRDIVKVEFSAEEKVLVNEAFAVVPMAFMKELKIPREKINVNGGACSLGHPIGASGARILVSLINSLSLRGLKKGVAAICIGGGEALAIAIEVD